jgi:hypothetical protein
VSDKMVLARHEHQVVYQELTNLVKKHAGTLSQLEILAVAANMVGKLIALQDQTAVTPEQAMKIISYNIEAGNREAFAEADKMRQASHLATTPAASRA